MMAGMNPDGTLINKPLQTIPPGHTPADQFGKKPLPGTTAAKVPAAGSGKRAAVKAEDVEEATEGLISKMDDDVLIELAKDWIDYLTSANDFTDDSVRTMKTLINVLAPAPRKLFDAYVGAVINPSARDPEGVSELLSCVGETLALGDKSPKHSH